MMKQRQGMNRVHEVWPTVPDMNNLTVKTFQIYIAWRNLYMLSTAVVRLHLSSYTGLNSENM